MPQFRYESDEDLTYNEFGPLVRGDVVDAEPGDDVPPKARAAWTPDHRFVRVGAPKAAAKKTASPKPTTETTE